MPEDPKAATGGNLVQYSEWKEEDATAEEAELDRSSSEFVKFKAGRHVVRFMPGRLGSGPFKVTWQHFFYPPGRQSPIVFNCPLMMGGPKDVVCGEVERMRASGNKADRDRAFDMAPKIRVFASIIDRAHPDRGPQVWGYGKSIHEQLVQIRKDPDGGDFTHPLKGFDIVIVREGEGKNDTEYFVRAARNTSPLHEDITKANEWLSAMADLSRYATIPSPDDIKKIIAAPDRDSGRGGRDRGEREVNPRKRTAQDEIEPEYSGGKKAHADDEIPF